MIYLGIDPGYNVSSPGAVAILRTLADGNATPEIIDTPATDVEMAAILRPFAAGQTSEGVFALLEKAPEMFRRPATAKELVKNPRVKFVAQPATALYGHYRAWRGILAALEIPFDELTPRQWQKMFLGTRPPGASGIKDYIWERSARLFPGDVVLKGPRGRKLYGRSDALALAELARRGWK